VLCVLPVAGTAVIAAAVVPSVAQYTAVTVVVTGGAAALDGGSGGDLGGIRKSTSACSVYRSIESV
jgi:hypothetical protein